jgi:hypothetical protein
MLESLDPIIKQKGEAIGPERSRVESEFSMAGRISLTARIGLGLLLIPLGALAVWTPWYSTRYWEPLNIPISLARGHLGAEFDINVPSRYTIEIRMNPTREEERPRCADGSLTCGAVTLIGARWSLSHHEDVVAGGVGEPNGTFECDGGHYILDIDAPEDQSRLNFYEPRLVIYEAGGKSDSTSALGALSLAALVLFGPLGASMTILAAIHWRQEKLATFLKAHPLTQAGPAGEGFVACSTKTDPLRRLRPKSSTARPLSRLSAHSLVMFLTFLIVWIPWALITPLFPHGLPST